MESDQNFQSKFQPLNVNKNSIQEEEYHRKTEGSDWDNDK